MLTALHRTSHPCCGRARRPAASGRTCQHSSTHSRRARCLGTRVRTPRAACAPRRCRAQTGGWRPRASAVCCRLPRQPRPLPREVASRLKCTTASGPIVTAGACAGATRPHGGSRGDGQHRFVAAQVAAAHRRVAVQPPGHWRSRCGGGHRAQVAVEGDPGLTRPVTAAHRTCQRHSEWGGAPRRRCRRGYALHLPRRRFAASSGPLTASRRAVTQHGSRATGRRGGSASSRGGCFGCAVGLSGIV